MFTCCHPALPLEARVALTLRTLAGLTTAEIARAFLVPGQTMGKRLVRAKHKIQNAGIPCRGAPARLLPDRTAGILLRRLGRLAGAAASYREALDLPWTWQAPMPGAGISPELKPPNPGHRRPGCSRPAPPSCRK